MDKHQHMSPLPHNLPILMYLNLTGGVTYQDDHTIAFQQHKQNQLGKRTPSMIPIILALI